MNSKIKGETLAKLETAMLETLKAHGLTSDRIANNRHAWDVFHKAAQEGRVNVNALYRDHNDNHIETALRSIFKFQKGCPRW